MKDYTENNKEHRIVSLSIVSHGQIRLVKSLLSDLCKFCDSQYEVILTINIPEQLQLKPESYPFLVKVVTNDNPKGFGANHNKAFTVASGKYFCVMNPDIRLIDNPFTKLMNCFNAEQCGLVAPRVVDPEGKMEDSARMFPTPLTIIAKALRKLGKENTQHKEIIEPDWVAGMFMFLKRSAFEQLHGFDERYFLYYEDVDLCARLRLAGYDIRLCPEATVIHDAQRESHRQIKYFIWHLTSMMRFFTSRVFFKVLLR